jgi:hypothetical protein
VYATGAWSAWRVHRRRGDRPWGDGERQAGDWAGVVDPAALAEPISLSALVEQGYEPAAAGLEHRPVGGRLALVVDLLVGHGWPRPQALAVIDHVASSVEAGRRSRGVPGWRRLAAVSGLPAWQARRVTVLLLGAPGRPGLVERLVTEGPASLRDAGVQAAVRATRVRRTRMPARVARAVTAGVPRTGPVAS